MKIETKAALRDRQTKIDRHVSNLGQAAAKRYLDGRPQPSGKIRDAIASVVLLALIVAATVLVLAL